MKYIQSYYTDIGVKRKTNQDSLALLKADTDYGEVVLAAICDGMGGYQFGELASKTVVKSFEQWFKTEFPIMLYNGLTWKSLRADWSRLIGECNSRLVTYGERHGMKMGSTLTAFLFVRDQYYIAHVGDSRGYVVGDYNVLQLTHDHSLVADEVRRGIITAEQAKTDRRRNILIECVGITNSLHIDFYSGTVMPNVCYLICTDGFWHNLSEKEMVRYLSGSQFKDNRMMRMHLNFLIEQVKVRGEWDNITAIGIVPVPDD